MPVEKVESCRDGLLLQPSEDPGQGVRNPKHLGAESPGSPVIDRAGSSVRPMSPGAQGEIGRPAEDNAFLHQRRVPRPVQEVESLQDHYLLMPGHHPVQGVRDPKHLGEEDDPGVPSSQLNQFSAIRGRQRASKPLRRLQATRAAEPERRSRDGRPPGSSDSDAVESELPAKSLAAVPRGCEGTVPRVP